MNEIKRAVSTRTPQWKSGDKHTLLQCTNCGRKVVIEKLDVEMHCPSCDRSEWVLEQPRSGERTQIPTAMAATPPKVPESQH